MRHEIVHNRYVVETLEAKGAIFVEELDEVPDGLPVIFSAHGVPKVVPAEAERRKLFYVDATCPLVSKVHREAERHFRDGRKILLIGHAGHPEVIGTMGQLPAGSIVLIEDVEQAEALDAGRGTATRTWPTSPRPPSPSTTPPRSSMMLRRRFPRIHGPKQEDICYATTNRQLAVKAIAKDIDALLVVGAPNSSNSARLVEVASKLGCKKAMLVQRAAQVDWNDLAGVARLGITAGASAPEVLVEEVIAACRERYDVTIEEITVTTENVQFKLPRVLSEKRATA